MQKQQNISVNQQNYPLSARPAEAAVIGSMILDNTVIPDVAENVCGEDFTDPDLRLFFEEILRLWQEDNRRIVDGVIVRNELDNRKMMTEGRFDLLKNAVESVPASSNAVYYARQVGFKSKERQLLQAIDNVKTEIWDVNLTLDEKKELFERAAYQLASTGNNEQVADLETLVRDVYLAIEQKKQNGLKTGFPEIDKKINGLKPSELIIVAARPSMGKTSLAVDIAMNVSVNEQVVIFSMEQTPQALTERMLANKSCISIYKMRGYMNDADWLNLANACGEVGKLKIWIDGTPALTPSALTTKILKYKHHHKISLAIVDYLQLMHIGGYKDNRQQEITKIVSEIKAAAKTANIPVILLSQLNRACEYRSDHIPQLSDLRESGCLAWYSEILLSDKVIPMCGLHNCSNIVTSKGIVNADKCEMTGKKQTHTLTLTTGHFVNATENHKFLTTSGWKELKEITKADKIAIPINFQNKNKPTIKDEEAELLGMFLSNGSLLERQPLMLCNNANDCDVAQRARKCADIVFNGNVVSHTKKERNWIVTYFKSKQPVSRYHRNPLALWAESFKIWNVRSPYKKIPDEIIGQPEDIICKMIRAMWDNDGTLFTHVSGGKRNQITISYSSASEELVRRLQLLLQKTGIVSTIKETKKGKYIWYNLSLTNNESYRVFLSKIGTNKARRKPIANRMFWILKDRKDGWTKQERRGNLVYIPVKSVKKYKKEMVYDIINSSHNEFIANGIIVHNSIEQDADVVLFLHREDYYRKQENPDTRLDGEALLIVAKNRQGATGRVKLIWIGERFSFKPYYEENHLQQIDPSV